MSRILPITPLLLVLAGCEPKWDLNPSQDRLVRRWLMCEECTRGELDSVLALGLRGEAAMEHALKYGPTRKRRDNMRRQAEAMYARIPSPAPVTRERYVDHYLSNYLASYSSRAIVALQRFNAPSAQAALRRAVRPDTRYRYDVRRLLGEVVGVSLSKVAGDSQHAPFDSVVRLDPTILVRDATGQALSNVRAVFRVDSGGGSVRDSVRLTGPGGRASVRWSLGPSDSVNVLRAIAGGRVVRFLALGHPLEPRIVFVVQPTTATRGQQFSPAPEIAVHDAWGTVQTTFSGAVNVVIPGTSASMIQPIAGGRARLENFVPTQPGNNVRLMVTSPALRPALSRRFDVLP